MIKKEKILEYLIYFLVFLLPWQTRWIIKLGELSGGYWEYGTISLYVFDLFLMIALAIFIWATKKSEVKKYNRWPFIGIGIFVLINSFWAENWKLALFYDLRLALAVGFFIILSKAMFNRLYLIYVFLASVFLHALLGIWQFLSQSTFSSKYLGIAWHDAGALGTSVIETINGERWLRAYGGLDHPNMLGGLLVVSALMAIALFANNGISRKTRLLLICCYLTQIAALIFSFSRVSWSGLAVGLSMMLVAAAVLKKYNIQKKLLYIILITGVLFYIFGSIYSGLVESRLKANTRLEIKSTEERVDDYKYSINLLKKNWLIGVGVGNYGLELYKNYPEKSVFFYRPIHNAWLLILVEVGIIGTSIISYLIYRVIKGSNWQNKVIIFTVIAMMTGDHWWWSLHFGLMLLVLIGYKKI